MFKKRMRPRVSLGEKKEIHPERDWMMGLSVSTVVFLCTALYLGYHFYVQLKEEPIQESGEIATVEYKQKEVESILSQYEENKAMFEKLRSDTQNIEGAQAPTIQVQNQEEERLAEEEGEQYSSDAMTAPVVE